MCAESQAAVAPSEEKEVRKLQKLLLQIEKLAARRDAGHDLQCEEREKLARQTSVELRLKELISAGGVEAGPVQCDKADGQETTADGDKINPAMGERSSHVSLADVPTPARCRLSSRSWYEDAVNIEDVQPPEIESSEPALVLAELVSPVIIPDIKPHTQEIRGDPVMQAVLRQVRVLSNDCFLEDCLDGCSKRGGWRVSILAAGMESEDTAVLLGFIVFRLKTVVGCLSIAKLAVPESFRRRGYGRQLVQWSVDWAKTQPDIKSVALSSLAGAVTFYQRLGFKKLHEITAKDKTDDDDPYFPGQMYMECRIRRGGRRPGR